MKKRFTIALTAVTIFTPLIVLAQWQGAPGSPPGNNAQGPMWVQSGTPVMQTGNVGINGDQYLSSSKAFRIDGAGTTALNFGNWYASGNGFVINTYGHMNMFPASGSTTAPILNMAGQSRLNVYQICLNGDCKTGWPSGGAGGDIWSENGTDIYYNGGNVGVGTATPKSRFQIGNNTQAPPANSADYAAFQVLLHDMADAKRSYGIGVDTANLDMWFNTDKDYRFYRDSAANPDVTFSGGRVGIGTDTPGDMLHVYRNGNASMIVDSNAASRNAQTHYVRGAAKDTYVGPSSANSFDLWTEENIPTIFGNNGNETMRITPTGNVGIGMNAPTEKLSVSAGTAGSAIIHLEADMDNNNENDVSGIEMYQDGAATLAKIALEGTGGTSFPGSLSNALMIGGFTNVSPVQLVTNSLPRLTITTAGRIGINETSPDHQVHSVNTVTNGAAIYGISRNPVDPSPGPAGGIGVWGVGSPAGKFVNNDVLSSVLLGGTSDAIFTDGIGNTFDTTSKGKVETGTTASPLVVTPTGNQRYGIQVVAGGSKTGISATGTVVGGDFTTSDTGSGYALRTHGWIDIQKGPAATGGGLTIRNASNESEYAYEYFNTNVFTFRLSAGASNGYQFMTPGAGVALRIGDSGTLTVGGALNTGGAASIGGNLSISGGTATKPGGGSWSAPSDIRLKDVKGSYTRGLEEISKLSPIYYSFKENNAKGIKDTKSVYTGFSAQEVEKVIPEAVSMDSSGYRQLNADPILWAMVNSIKELKSQNEALQARIEKLEAAR